MFCILYDMVNIKHVIPKSHIRKILHSFNLDSRSYYILENIFIYALHVKINGRKKRMICCLRLIVAKIFAKIKFL